MAFTCLCVHRVEDFSYDDLLTTSQLETLGSLSGCISHRRMNFSCNQDKCFNRKYRTIDGTCNNPSQIMWGASYTPFQRLLTSQYENAFNLPKGTYIQKQSLLRMYYACCVHIYVRKHVNTIFQAGRQASNTTATLYRTHVL